MPKAHRLLSENRLWRLIAIRWSAQLTDGLYQSALASYVLFSPERQASATAAAIAFTTVLLPYSLIGPFVGTILDKYSRRQILFFANLARTITLMIVAAAILLNATGFELTLIVLISFGINRLILAGLSASLPRVVTREILVAANALTVTGGTIAIVLGGGIGIGLRNIFESQSGADQVDAALVLFGALGYFISALFSLRLRKDELGPTKGEISAANKNWKDGFSQMREGFVYLKSNKDSGIGICAVAIQRGGLTALTLMALILERNAFHSPSNPDAGLSGFARAITIAGIGIMLGAVISPAAVRRFGRHRWMRIAMLIASFGPAIFIISQSEIAMIAMGFVSGFGGQGVKVTNDALVQEKISDDYRGRVFAVYDVVVNAAIVSGSLIAAAVMPKTGLGITLPLIITTLYLGTALALRKNWFKDSIKSR
ncbi:MFS transporter [Actinomycetes bacterium]|nr:MFS transporter [Actinomycetes bacterium]